MAIFVPLFVNYFVDMAEHFCYNRYVERKEAMMKKDENGEKKVEAKGADKFDAAINMLTAFSEAAHRLSPRCGRRMDRAIGEAIFGDIFGVPTRRRGRRRF